LFQLLLILPKVFADNALREKIQFYSISKGSLTEIQNQLLIAKDIGYISKKDFQLIAEQSIEVNKLSNGLIRYLRR